MADFAVQRGSVDIALSGTSVTITAGVDYTAPASASAAFIRIVGVNQQGSGVQDNDFGGNVGANAIGVTDPGNITTSITFARTTGTGGPLTITWEIVEYTGSISGANEFIVRHTEVITSATSSSTDDSSTVSGVADNADVVVFITGIDCDSGGRSESEEIGWTSEYIGGSSVARITRGPTVDEGTDTSIAVVEFTGSNWKIQRIEHTYTSGNTDETESITTLGAVSKAFLHHQSRVDGNNAGPDAAGQLCTITSTTQLTFNKFSLNSGAVGVAWVIENTQSSGTVMNVAAYSGTRAANTGGDPDTFTQAVTAVSALAESSVMGEGANTTRTADTHSVMLGFELTSTTVVTMNRGRDIADRDWQFQTVEWPTVSAGGTTVAIPVGSLSLTGQVPTIVAGNNISVAIPVGSLALSGFVPTVITGAGITVDIPVGALALSGFAPSVVEGNNIAVEIPLGGLALSGFVPFVDLGNLQVEIPLGSLSFTGLMPSVIIGGEIWTKQFDSTTSWANQADETTSWSEQTNATTIWTKQ